MEVGTKYDEDKLKKDMRELKIENRIQTVAVILFFFFGIATIADIYRKIKK
jgi:hypothetical protein